MIAYAQLIGDGKDNNNTNAIAMIVMVVIVVVRLCFGWMAQGTAKRGRTCISCMRLFAQTAWCVV